MGEERLQWLVLIMIGMVFVLGLMINLYSTFRGASVENIISNGLVLCLFLFLTFHYYDTKKKSKK